MSRAWWSALLLSALLPSGCRDLHSAEPPPPRAIKTLVVGTKPGPIERSFWGVVRAKRRSELGFEVGGRVSAVEVDVGDRLEVGRPLASLEARPFRLAVDRAQARLRSARAAKKEAQRRVESTTRLHAEGVATRTSLDRAASELEIAQGEFDSARAAVSISRRQLEQTVLAAPFSGFVVERRVEPHEEVQPGATALVVQGDGAMSVEVFVPETSIERVRAGSRVAIEIPTPRLQGRTLGGVVAQVAAAATQANAFAVEIDLLDPIPGLRAGMTAEVAFAFEHDSDQPGWLVPLSAILPVEATSSEPFVDQALRVFVVDPTSRILSIREVRGAGVRADDVIVRQGLESGEIIAVAGVHHLRDGQEVRLLGDDELAGR